MTHDQTAFTYAGDRPDLEIELHGHRVCFRLRGEGPLVVLIHGITGRSEQWEPAIDQLARRPHAAGAGPARPRRVGEAARRLLARRLRERRPRHDGRPRPRPGDDRRPLARRRDRDAVRLPVPRALRAARPGLQRRPGPRGPPAAARRDPARLGARCCRCSPTPRLLAAGEAVGRALGRLRPAGRAPTSPRSRAASPRSATSEARARVHPDDARGARPRRPARQRARPPLPRRVACPRCWSGATPTRSSPPSTAAPRTRRCPAAAWSCSTGVGHFPQLERPRRVLAAARRVHRRDRARGARHVDDPRPAAGAGGSRSPRA